MSQLRPRCARRALRSGGTLLVALLALAGMASCGGAAGGIGPLGAGQDLVLQSFSQEGVDNVSLNDVLYFTFSEPVDPTTVSPATLQIREGPSFGQSVDGEYVVLGSVVEFRPTLPGLCDRSDSGLKPDTFYSVQCVGSPEEFAIRNTRGQSLDSTITMQFRTRLDGDSQLLSDPLPGEPPLIVSATPDDGDHAVTVEQGNRIVLEYNQNLDPCSVTSNAFRLQQYEVGEKLANFDAGNGNTTGFDSIIDADIPNKYSWGSGNSTALSPAPRIPIQVTLEQDYVSTYVIITPVFGEFLDNALLVLEVSNDVRDFGGQLGTARTLAFTTENRPQQTGTFALDFQGEVDIDENSTNADVNTTRSPSRVQGYMLFAGDGDNGDDLLSPSGPELPGACTDPRQENSGDPSDFDADSPMTLDTGATPNTCPNQTDGSRAVVWEFNSFRIRSGAIVRIIGVNPAILLVNGSVTIEPGATLLVRGDGQGGGPQSNGRSGSSGTSYSAGGIGVAGGGSGGRTYSPYNSPRQLAGQAGFAGFGSPDYDASMSAGGVGEGGLGGGDGGTSDNNSNSFGDGASQGGGGGGHTAAGATGVATPFGGHTFAGPIRGSGGGIYPTDTSMNRMLTPEAGSGGGGAGDSRYSSSSFSSYGGSGGAGGGFVDLTAAGNIAIFGTVDAAGGRGGGGYTDPSWTATGGGGGGSGGGIRMLTPGDISLAGGTLTTAGGLGGTAGSPTNNPNVGGSGGSGRIALEDGDSVITGQNTALLTPSEPSNGFYRGTFDAGRFAGGGLTPVAVTLPFYVGPLAANFATPTQSYGGQTDFLAGVPRIASRGVDSTAILVEAQGFPLLASGEPDLLSPSGWYTVGHFTDSGIDLRPEWHAGAQPMDGVPVGAGNLGTGLSNLNGSGAIQVRVTVYLPSSVGPFDGGPFLDRWNVRFVYNQ